jgi:hypothetical protein
MTRRSLLALVAPWVGFTLLPVALATQERTTAAPTRVAVTPIVHGELPLDSGQAFAERMARHVRARNPGLAVVGPRTATSILETQSMAAEWGQVLFTFLTTGIVDGVALKAVCNALDVDAILHAEIAALIERGPWTLWRRHVLQELRVIIRGWLFDCTSGLPIWERAGTGRFERIQDSHSPAFSLSAIPAVLPTSLAVSEFNDALPRIRGSDSP